MRRICDLRFAICDWSLALLAAFCLAADWKTAQPGWRYEFPRDHHAHEEFKTEWWYFTGNLFDSAGRRFGYQLTFFRQGIRPPAQRDPNLSRFVVNDLKFAHFTVTDIAGREFRFEQKTSRGAFGDAGFDRGDQLAWIDSWRLQMEPAGSFRLQADTKEMAINLRLESAKPPAIHGRDGISQKAAGEGHASHYYSLTRLTTTGEARVRGKTFQVTGESWFDHEWATNQLAPEQVGWDWLSVQFADGTELMLYQMRLENGASDPSSSGTLIEKDGGVTHLASSAFRMIPVAFWKSKATGAHYPTEWRVELPSCSMQITARAALADQELAFKPLTYWEGAIEVAGVRAGRPVTGRGYLELTGYAGPLRELQR
jgi:predicted secreted hydrolase